MIGVVVKSIPPKQLFDFGFELWLKIHLTERAFSQKNRRIGQKDRKNMWSKGQLAKMTFNWKTLIERIISRKKICRKEFVWGEIWLKKHLIQKTFELEIFGRIYIRSKEHLARRTFGRKKIWQKYIRSKEHLTKKDNWPKEHLLEMIFGWREI